MVGFHGFMTQFQVGILPSLTPCCVCVLIPWGLGDIMSYQQRSLTIYLSCTIALRRYYVQYYRYHLTTCTCQSMQGRLFTSVIQGANLPIVFLP
ncbi:hypothetical protein GGS24DRAFT_463515 [Hypoxylon argillaceum]|nr:hypothetical protein GGS24DRAFT_463515 [Hypoxylon argillaceum]